MSIPYPHYKKVYRKPNIIKSWKHIQSNARTSSSKDTVDEVNQYEAKADTNINKLIKSLKNKNFIFDKAFGYEKEKRSKKDTRPIVVHSINNRIVQRSILDVLSNEKKFKSYINSPNSYGGIKGLGVQDALKAIINAINNGNTFYLRSDISDFFTKVDRQRVINKINEVIKDVEFISLVDHAMKTELKNMDQIKNIGKFPLSEIGVAQGCCLSPLFGNILLNEFDISLNDGGIVCIRYIDDFVILGKTEKVVRKAFKACNKLLNELQLSAYDPNESGDKARFGNVKNGFDFLGCNIRPWRIIPTKNNRDKLVRNIDEILKTSISELLSPKDAVKQHKTLVDTLNYIGNVIRGWGNQYKYCNNLNQIYEQLDRKIDDRISAYLSQYSSIRKKLIKGQAYDDARRILGVYLLVDSKSTPIIKSTNSPK